MCRTVWMWLLILAVLSLFSESEAELWIPPCCTKSSNAKIPNIKACYKQEPRTNCNFHAFVIVTEDNKQYCVDPNAQWLKRLRRKGNVRCPPIITEHKRRFEVLNKVDME
ncbi:Hypothetical predicted protein [Scomber scombrus]|uniref:Chemokine interleukin-8-like domain-containing protein n=1 Tax=Scomber scombrus TaxID=13677 RepID=A0AAV1QN74_SCOSC